MKKLFSKLMLVAMAVATFTACEDVPEPYNIPSPEDDNGNSTEIEGATGSGTLADPFNAVAALNYGKKLASGESSTDYMFIKGRVVSIKEQFSTQYGNGTFYISSDGTAQNQFYAYRVLYLGNKKFTSSDKPIEVGDEVIVCGVITNYNGTIETAQGQGFLYSLNGEDRGGAPNGGGDNSGTATGDGTLANPFNSVAAIAYAKQVGNAESEKEVYIKGKVAEITEQYGTQFGNATFTVSDDGTSSNAFTIYRALYLGNKKYTSGALLEVGNEVIVYGKVTCYMGNKPETVQGKAYLYSLNGKTEGGGDTPTPDPQPSGEVKTVSIADFNDAEVSNDVWYQLTGKVTNLKPDDIYGNFDLADETGSVYVYGLLSEKGGAKKLFQELVVAKGIKEGSTLTLIGNRGEYNGKIEVMNAYFVSVEGGSDTPDDPTPGGDNTGNKGTLSGNQLTLVTADLGIDNGTEPGTITLVDGTTISFDGGGNSNTPKYYNSGTSIRMYPKNTMIIKASGKTIKSIKLSCSTSNGTLCNAGGEVNAAPGSVAVSGDDLDISAINSSSTTITNNNGNTGAASQLRITQLVITYAE